MNYPELIEWTNAKLEMLPDMGEKSQTTARRKIGEVVFKNALDLILPIVKKSESYTNRKIIFSKITDTVEHAGICRTRKFLDYSDNKAILSEVSRISISRRIFLRKNGQFIVDTMLHELIHATLPFNSGHGIDFHTFMGEINEELGSHISVYFSSVTEDGFRRIEEESYRYAVICPQCHTVFKQCHRKTFMINHPECFRCTKCHVHPNVIDYGH